MTDTGTPPRTPSPYETAIRLGHEVDEVRTQLAQARQELAALREALLEREQWFTKEISGGGNFEHLNARRSECAYIRNSIMTRIMRKSG